MWESQLHNFWWWGTASALSPDDSVSKVNSCPSLSTLHPQQCRFRRSRAKAAALAASAALTGYSLMPQAAGQRKDSRTHATLFGRLVCFLPLSLGCRGQLFVVFAVWASGGASPWKELAPQSQSHGICAHGRPYLQTAAVIERAGKWGHPSGAWGVIASRPFG